MNQNTLDSKTTQAEVKDAIASCYGTSASNVTLIPGHTYSINLGGSSGSGSFNTEFRIGYGNYYLKVFKTGDSNPCSLTIVDDDIDGF